MLLHYGLPDCHGEAQAAMTSISTGVIRLTTRAKSSPAGDASLL
jgi:hypothetical protein